MTLLRSWLMTCSSVSSTKSAPDDDDTNTTNPISSDVKPTQLKHFASDTSNSSLSSSQESSTINTNYSSCSSLQSNLSLQTLPSIPSLQNKTSSESSLLLNISISCVSTFKPQNHQINSIAITGKLLYVASANEINVFDLTNYTRIDSFNHKESKSAFVKSIVFSNGNVITAHQDCKIRVWKITENKRHRLIATLPILKDRFLRFALPKNYVSVRRHRKRLWIEHIDTVSGLSVGEGLIYSVSWDKHLKIWRSRDLLCLESIKAHEDAVNAVAVSVDGTVYTGSADRRIKVWGKGFNEKGHGLIATLEKHKSAVNALALSTDGSVLFSGACDRSILVWERDDDDSARHMVVTGALRGHSGAILCLINVSDLLMSGSADWTIRIWQRRVDGRYCCLAVLEGHERPVKSLVAVFEENVSDGGNFTVCSGSLDGEVKVWKVSVSSLIKKSSESPDLLKFQHGMNVEEI